MTVLLPKSAIPAGKSGVPVLKNSLPADKNAAPARKNELLASESVAPARRNAVPAAKSGRLSPGNVGNRRNTPKNAAIAPSTTGNSNSECVGRRAGAAASRQSAANCAGNSNGGFLPKAATRKAAKRHRKLAGDNVPGERENRIASRSDDGKCAMIQPSLQDGFYFGRCNPARCAGLISGCPCRDERGAGRTQEAGR